MLEPNGIHPWRSLPNSANLTLTSFVVRNPAVTPLSSPWQRLLIALPSVKLDSFPWASFPRASFPRASLNPVVIHWASVHWASASPTVQAWMQGLRGAALRLKRLVLPSQGPQGVQREHRWRNRAIALGAIAGLLLWDWTMTLALGMGLGVMALTFWAQQQDWQTGLDRLRRWLEGPQRLLPLSVGAGGTAMLGTYATASVWTEGNTWVAASLLLEGLAIVVLLLLVMLQLLERQGVPSGLGEGVGDRLESVYEQALLDLSHPQALKRLLALRQLERLQVKGRLTSAQAQMAQRALQLVLVQEPEQAIREAAADSLTRCSY